MNITPEQAIGLLEQAANLAPLNPVDRRTAFTAVDVLRTALVERSRLLDAQNVKTVTPANTTS